MSIEVTCPQGHRLRLKDSMAGKKGLCPLCKAPVQVPKREERRSLSEEAILDILGPSDGSSSQVLSFKELQEFEQGGSRVEEGHHPTPHKVCTKCYREIPSAIHICPFCHTYIAELTDFKAI
jgi:hypothetical protein